MEGNEHGAFVDLVIGIAGALVGRFAIHFLGIKAEGGRFIRSWSQPD
jgi:uncharacterized membrane protein YeaQ/YmgE (transglycosylase-associated protein family)